MERKALKAGFYPAKIFIYYFQGSLELLAMKNININAIFLFYFTADAVICTFISIPVFTVKVHDLMV